MACGCKNKGANASAGNSVVKSSPSVTKQESKPQKTVNGMRIIKREIR